MIKPKVSIIILNWNGLHDTQKCLYSLKKNHYSPLEIIVVDNGSDNNEANNLKNEFGNYIEMIYEPTNLGFAEGSNVGIRRAIKSDAKYVCLLNNDTIVDPNFINELVSVAELDTSIAMVAPTMRMMTRTSEIDNLGITFTLSGLSFNRKDTRWRMLCPSGGAVLYRCSALIKIAVDSQFFDPTYFAYAEDLDLGFRLILHGFHAAFAPKSIVFHRGSGSTSFMSNFALYYSQRNLLLTWVKNLPFKFLIKYGWLMIIIQFTHALLFIRRRKFLIMLKANMDALRLIPNYIRLRKTSLANNKSAYKNLLTYIEPKILPLRYIRGLFQSNRTHSLK